MSLSQPNGPEDSDLTALLDDWDNTVEPLGQGTTTFAAGPQQGIELAAQHGDLQQLMDLLPLRMPEYAASLLGDTDPGPASSAAPLTLDELKQLAAKVGTADDTRFLCMIEMCKDGKARMAGMESRQYRPMAVSNPLFAATILLDRLVAMPTTKVDAKPLGRIIQRVCAICNHIGRLISCSHAGTSRDAPHGRNARCSSGKQDGGDHRVEAGRAHLL